MKDLYDVVIVGAGPGGSATAHYLAKAGASVLLLDKFNFPRDKTCGDALTPRALRILDDMDILHSVQQVGYRLDKIEFIAPKGQRAIAELSETKDGCDYLHFAPRMRLDHIILKRALASGAHFESPVRVTGVVRDGSDMVVSGEQQGKVRSFRARLVVIAIGASTKLLLQTEILKKMPQMMLCARTYYEGITHQVDVAQCRFDGVPLPGYGWVFPVSASAVNVGVGLFRSGWASRRSPRTAHAAFDAFMRSQPLLQLLAGARQTDPVKGYPLRVDFARSPTCGERMLLVGEAAGLVNPVTGEGIDYALESGKMAAEHLLRQFAVGDFSLERLLIYDKLLRQRYQRLFVLCDRLRNLYLNPLILNKVIRAVASSNDLMELFIRIAIENQSPNEGLTPATIARVLFRGMTAPSSYL